MANPQRIISLLPSATEILVAVGAGADIVGTTHECPRLPSNPKACTANMLPPGLSAAEIDAAVNRSLAADPHTIYRLDKELVASLAPTVVVTQALCAVCAVPETDVRAVACTLPGRCNVVTADPHTLGSLYGVISSVAAAVGRQAEASALNASLVARVDSVRKATKPLARRRVMVLEWPDPPFAPGHWVPDQIDAAGGVCVLGKSGEKSVRVTWKTLMDAKPDVVVNAYCGYDLRDNEKEVDKLRDRQEWKELIKDAEVYATNATAYYSRPGPRLVDGTELMAYILHGLDQFRPSDMGRGSVLRQGQWIDLAKA